MKSTVIFFPALIIILILGHYEGIGQSPYVKFVGKNQDYRTRVDLDSVYLFNKTSELDTMLRGTDIFEYGTSTGTRDPFSFNSSDFILEHPYPNPFERNSDFTISCSEGDTYSISVIDLKGQVVSAKTIYLEPGRHNIRYIGEGSSAGVYLIKVRSTRDQQIMKLIKKGNSGSFYSGMQSIIYEGSTGLDHKGFKTSSWKEDDEIKIIAYAESYCPDTLDNQFLKNNKIFSLKYSGDCGDKTIWYDWTMYPDDLLSIWGMGEVQTEYIHNDRPYSWYIDQANTGSASGNNCGPSSVTMAIKWADSTFTNTAEEARNTYPRDGGWWYTNDITNYLGLKSIPFETVRFNDSIQIREILSEGAIIIACLNTQHLKRDNQTHHRVNRFYSFAGGHFFVIKGLRVVDGAYLFETYDPNNWNMTYIDESDKGKNRHYTAEDLAASISNWWNYLIVVSEKGGIPLKHSIIGDIVNPDEIPHKWGR